VVKGNILVGERDDKWAVSEGLGVWWVMGWGSILLMKMR
jgi:hypothetical protein